MGSTTIEEVICLFCGKIAERYIIIETRDSLLKDLTSQKSTVAICEECRYAHKNFLNIHI